MKITTEVSGHDIATLLMKNTSPVGDTNHDNESNTKLREVAEVARSIIDDMWWIYYENKDCNEYSVKEASGIAKNALLGIKEMLEELSED